MPKIAYAHDWIVRTAGAENVLKEMLQVYKGRVYTLFYKKEVLKELGLTPEEVSASFLNNLPYIEIYYRNLLPFFPIGISSLTVREADILISSSHAVANGISKQDGIFHISYCHTPMRYIWTHKHYYFNSLPKFKKYIFKFIIPFLQKWDTKIANKVDLFVATSSAVKERIKKIYGKDAIIVHPPVRSREFSHFFQLKKNDYYVYAGRLDIPYKRVDLVIRAFNKLNKKLIIIGDGFDKEKLKKISKSNIKFLGWKKEKELCKILAGAKALILPSEEDFGIISVEAQACGTPIIAYAKGGALDTVIPYKTGLFFYKQEEDDLIQVIEEFEKNYKEFSSYEAKENALKFDTEIFKDRFKKLIRKYT